MMSLDRKRAFGWWFLLAVSAYLLLYLNGISYMLSDEQGDALMIFEFSGAMGFAVPMMPLISALAYATSFCQDYNAVFCPAAVTRSGKRRYIQSKVIAVALSGGAAVAGGMLVFILFLNIKFPPDVSQSMIIEGASDLSALLANPGVWPLIMYYGARLILHFLCGSFWAMGALAFSAFYPNVPLTLCAPLVLYRLASELGAQPFMPAFLSLTWLADGQVGLMPGQTMLAGVLVFGLGTLGLAALFQWRAWRRLNYA